MTDIIKDFFEKEKIEYYTVLDYKHLHETNGAIAARAGFVPRTAIVFLIPYFVSVPKNISRYAASLDYHIVIGEITSALISALSEKFPEYSFRGFGDHSPIDERHAALIGGLGILGDNGLLINEKYGTYVFIADVLTDMPPELLSAKAPGEITLCSHCAACKRACPTGILKTYEGECLSAITQRKGELTEEEVELMRKFDTVWGCDVCQSVCPHNKSPKKTPIEFFYKDRVELLTTKLLDSLSRTEFKSRAFGWRGKAVVKRNLQKLGY